MRTFHCADVFLHNLLHRISKIDPLKISYQMLWIKEVVFDISGGISEFLEKSN
ncbi:hypothetical protein LEP1GSC060_1635 [Leptospira weilii serovar Ranarum str. ICFT]|uniref:Uncharacterized protein n=1 Tax=Leptospira weilii serovar Ranarum str. ICFT TaxID=1218598 RepID=N1WGA0_9LEPT|nr:hypothetical protein LEP1GSC060_1635 [Leptospira weilii serovar Ranarum str. ICFT]